MKNYLFILTLITLTFASCTEEAVAPEEVLAVNVQNGSDDLLSVVVPVTPANYLNFGDLVTMYSAAGFVEQAVPASYTPLALYAQADLFYFVRGTEERYLYKYPSPDDIPNVQNGGPSNDCATGTFQSDQDEDGNINESCTGAALDCNVKDSDGDGFNYEIVCCD